MSLADQLMALATDAPVLISIFDRQDRLLFANKAFRDCFALEDDYFPTWAEMLRRNWPRHLGTAIITDDFDKWLASASSRRGKTPFRAFETDMKDGRWLWMTESVGVDDSMLCIAVDITALATADRHLRHERDLALRASQTDELTGLANRRFMMNVLEATLKQAAPCCIALLDIDHFKTINDRFGHAVGDRVLMEFANHARAAMRRSDAFGRIGGEEFLLVMPEGTTAQATEILERVRAMLRQNTIMLADGSLSYTFSAGIALSAAGQNASDLLKAADDACYRAKAAGRDRTLEAGSMTAPGRAEPSSKGSPP